MSPTRHPVAWLKRTRIGGLFARPVSVGWIVLVAWVVFICVALIGWSVRSNYEADKNRDLRAEYSNCRAANDRREAIKDISLQFVENDRFFIEFVDSFIPGGLDVAFKQPLLDRYAQQVDDIRAAFIPQVCVAPSGVNDGLTD